MPLVFAIKGFVTSFGHARRVMDGRRDHSVAQVAGEKKDDLIRQMSEQMNEERTKFLSETNRLERAREDAHNLMAVNAAKFFLSNTHVDSRGILEFAHNWTCDCRFFSENNVRRQVVWKYALNANKDLRDCLKEKCGLSPQRAPRALTGIYQKLSGRIHSKLSPEFTRQYPVDLILDTSRDGILFPEETYALTCIARAFGTSYRLFDSQDIDRERPLEVFKGMSDEAECTIMEKFVEKMRRTGQRARGREVPPPPAKRRSRKGE